MFGVINHNLLKMKKILLIVTLIIYTTGSAQDEFFVGLHYFTIKKQFVKEFIEQEKSYFSKMHKASIDSGDKIGWDLWSVGDPFSGNEKYQTFCFAHLQPIDKPMGSMNSNLFSESEMKMVRKLRKKMVVKSKFIMTVFKGGFVPAAGKKPPKYLVLNFIDVDWKNYYEYEKLALSNIEDRKKSKYLKSWGLHKVVSRTNEKADYLAANFYDSPVEVYKRFTPTNPMSATQKKRRDAMGKMTKLIKRENMQLIMFER